MKRNTILYVLVLTVASLSLIWLLRAGSSLVPPGGAPVVTPVVSGGSMDSSMFSGLSKNLGEPLSHLFLQLLVIIGAAQLVGRGLSRFGMPTVVGEMIAGILLGPSLFGLLAPRAFAFVFPVASLGTLQLLSQVGVCLFMFAVGMELNVEHVRDKAPTAVVVSHASIVVPFLMGATLAWFLYSELAAHGASFTAFALFMGMSMSITAFPVLARILQERRMTRTLLGSTALTCAAVDDVTAWSLLAFIVAISRTSSMAGCALNLLFVVAFIAVMILLVKPALARVLGEARIAREEPSKGTLAAVICVTVGAALTTEMIGIHALFGAFLAGAIIPKAEGFREKLGVRVENFSSVLLLPLFFVFTGLRTQIGLLNDWSGILICLAIILVASAGKIGASAVAARLTGFRWSEALQLGALMNTRGLMELIALNIGYDLGILSPRIFAMLVIMALVTTILTGPLLNLFGERSVALDGCPVPARS
jgi:Kef-type K+ transport system membrane component KefB